MMNNNHMGMRALHGLNAVGSEMMPDMEMESEAPNSTKAIPLLKQAATLHKAHITGDAPVTEESQQELMDLIEDALESLTA